MSYPLPLFATKAVRALVVPVAVALGYAGHMLMEDPLPAATPPPSVQVAAEPEPVTLVVIEIDGLQVLPGAPVVDPRPVCDAGGNPISFHYRLVFSSGRWVIGQLSLPLYARMSFDLGQFGGLFEYTIETTDIYGDVNNSGKTDTIDMAIIRARRGPLAENPDRAVCDLDRSGTVDETDVDLCRQAVMY